MAITAKTFPGVYTQIIDQSFLLPARSRFRPGVIGVASKGPFDTPTQIRSLKEFVQTFGNPLTTEYVAVNADFVPGDSINDLAVLGEPIGPGYFLADAMAFITDQSDGAVVVRVGNRYANLPTADGSGSAGSYAVGMSTTNASFIDSEIADPDVDVYLCLTQAGRESTVDVKVDTVSGTVVNLLSTGDALQDDYTAASVAYSNYADAAFNAEGVLYAYSYGTSSSDVFDRAVTAAGTVSGTKNDFFFQVTSATSIAVGDVYKITEASKNPTHEIRVKQIIGQTVYAETSDITRVGYQALPLQDDYTAAALYKVNPATQIAYVWLEAKTAGSWANGASSAAGLYCRVRPGSTPGSKKIEVYWDSGLVETIDNIDETADADDANSYETRIGLSDYIAVKFRFDSGGGQVYQAANTVAPWDSAYYTIAVGPPKSMPVGAINAGILNSIDTGSQFTKGKDGSNAQASDFVGTIDPTDDNLSGLKAFEDEDNVDVNMLAAPMDDMPIEIMQEMRRVAKQINALAIADVPAGLTARQAIDWRNGAGQFVGRGRIDDYSIAIYWNWFTITDTFTGTSKLVPPTLGALRCFAFTFDNEKPWYAAAGETRGFIPEALSVQYERVSEDTKQSLFANGNGVNPILNVRGRKLVFGERTLQIADSKLTAVHSVILVNWVVDGLAELARQYVFDPNDQELLIQIRLSFTEFLDKIRNERGIEDYELVVDDRNNTPDTRNRREVIVDLAIIPTDVAERIYINATVRESGAILNTVQ